MRHRLMRKHLMITSTAIGTFTPANRDDFGARARFLSKLLKQPYQRCQESLAKLYGYGDLHQLQAAIKRAEVDPTLKGPYDDQSRTEERRGGKECDSPCSTRWSP